MGVLWLLVLCFLISSVILKGDGNPDDYYVLYEKSLQIMNFDTSFI